MRWQGRFTSYLMPLRVNYPDLVCIDARLMFHLCFSMLSAMRNLFCYISGQLVFFLLLFTSKYQHILTSNSSHMDSDLTSDPTVGDLDIVWTQYRPCASFSTASIRSVILYMLPQHIGVNAIVFKTFERIYIYYGKVYYILPWCIILYNKGYYTILFYAVLCYVIPLYVIVKYRMTIQYTVRYNVLNHSMTQRLE